jgi:predicted amidophosphoribosyltransferase
VRATSHRTHEREERRANLPKQEICSRCGSEAPRDMDHCPACGLQTRRAIGSRSKCADEFMSQNMGARLHNLFDGLTCSLANDVVEGIFEREDQ